MKKMKKVLFGALLFSMFNQMNFTNNKFLMKLKVNNDMDYKILNVEDYNLYDKNDLSNFLNQGGVIINNNEIPNEILNNYFKIENSSLSKDSYSYIYSLNGYYKINYFTILNNHGEKLPIDDVDAVSILSDVNTKINQSTFDDENIVADDDYSYTMYQDNDKSKLACKVEFKASVNYSNNKYYCSTILKTKCSNNYHVDNFTFKSWYPNLTMENVTYNFPNTFNHKDTTQNGAVYTTGTNKEDKANLTQTYEICFTTFAQSGKPSYSYNASLESLVVKDNGWWFLQKTCSFDSSKGKTININFDKQN